MPSAGKEEGQKTQRHHYRGDTCSRQDCSIVLEYLRSVHTVTAAVSWSVCLRSLPTHDISVSVLLQLPDSEWVLWEQSGNCGQIPLQAISRNLLVPGLIRIILGHAHFWTTLSRYLCHAEENKLTMAESPNKQSRSRHHNNYTFSLFR